MTAASSPSTADVETAVAHAVANAALAGVEFDEEWREKLRGVASGLINADELINQEIARNRSDRDP